MFEIQANKTIQEKLHILADAAKYDVACTSSGVDRKGKEEMLGNARSCGICHSFASDGRCISLLKILMTNHCIYDCKYCVNRVSNDVKRATFTPEEICELTIEFYKRNYIEGLFLSSGVIRDPAYTMEQICITLQLLRTKYRFNGYIHVKTIPGAPDELLAAAGFLADRISVNLELPTAESLKKLAPNKSFQTIMTPMGKVRDTIAETRTLIGKDARMERSLGNRYLPGSIFGKEQLRLTGAQSNGGGSLWKKAASFAPATQDTWKPRAFAPAGQSTQMIIGATGETDYQIMAVSEALYQRFAMKRVFYSAFINVNQDSALPETVDGPPLLREHRLYQADFLLRFYGFQTDELLSEKHPNFNELIDPKCDWAVHHLEQFPVEINRADYYTLLRVPGIGTKSAKRILAARRFAALDFADIKKMGVVLKRAIYFITCKGRMMYPTKIEEGYITRHLIYNEKPAQMLLADGSSVGYEQMTLQDYMDQRKEGE